MKKLLSILVVVLIAVSSWAVAEEYPHGEIYVRASGGSLNLRVGEGTNTRILGYVQQGDIVEIISSKGEWSYVYVRRTEQTGYVKTKYIVNIVYPETKPIDTPVQTLSADGLPSEPISLPCIFSLDLDGDGAPETLLASVEYMEEISANTVALSVWKEETERDHFSCELADSGAIWLARLDDSGHVFIFLCGDEMSDDYVTRCLFWNGASLQAVPFISPKPFASGAAFGGAVESIDGSAITISSIRDYFGTWFARITFRMNGGVLSCDDNAIWRINGDLSVSDTWEYRSLKTLCELPATVYGAETVLPAGTALMPTAIDDANNRVYFVTDSGDQGYFTCESAENGYKHAIGGISEENCFETLFYAD